MDTNSPSPRLAPAMVWWPLDPSVRRCGSTAVPVIRTVVGADPALPGRDGEVGAVPEYALLSALSGRTAGIAATAPTVLAPTDNTGMLRYT